MKTRYKRLIALFVFVILITTSCKTIDDNELVKDDVDKDKNIKTEMTNIASSSEVVSPNETPVTEVKETVEVEETTEVKEATEVKETASDNIVSVKTENTPMPIHQMSSKDENHFYKGIDISKRGNTSANVTTSNFGLVTKSGEWVYYYEPVTRQLIRMKSDGSDKTLISDEANFIYLNVVDDWVYYSDGGLGIWKIKTNGTEKTQLVTEDVENIMVIDEYIFYSVGFLPSEQRLKRIKTDGSDEKFLLDTCAMEPFFVDEKIYFSNFDALYSMDLNGDDVQQVFDCRLFYYFVLGDSLYTQGDTFDKISLVDGTPSIVSEKIFRNPMLFNDWIFYEDYDIQGPKSQLYCNTATLHRVKLDGTETSLVSNIQVWHYMVVDDEWVYYFPLYDIYSVEDDFQVMRRVRWDGTDDQPLTPVEKNHP